MFLFKLYNLLSYLLVILTPLIIKIRINKKKENPFRRKERYGIPSQDRPFGKLYWIHAVSVGELNSIIPLVQILHKKKINILVTTSSMSSANHASVVLKDIAIHQMLPIDCPVFVKAFLKHWQPNVVIFAESEIWPNFFHYIRQQSKLYLINCYISSQVYHNWVKYAKSLLIYCLNCCEVIFTNFQDTKDKLQQLNIYPDINLLPHTKYDTPILYSPPEGVWFCKKHFLDQKNIVITFGSAHPGEYELAIKIHKKLKEKFANLITIIAPRHLSNMPKLKNLTAEFKVSIHPNKIDPDSEIILVNTIGDLLSFYYLSDISVVCGSFVDNIGGHNPLEPANLGKAVVIGNYNESCREICNHLVLKNGIKIANSSNLLQTIENLIEHPEEIEFLGQNAAKYVASNKGSSLKIFYETTKDR